MIGIQQMYNGNVAKSHKRLERRTLSEKKAIVEEFRKSGLTAIQFDIKKGFNYNTIYQYIATTRL